MESSHRASFHSDGSLHAVLSSKNSKRRPLPRGTAATYSGHFRQVSAGADFTIFFNAFRPLHGDIKPPGARPGRSAGSARSCGGLAARRAGREQVGVGMDEPGRRGTTKGGQLKCACLPPPLPPPLPAGPTSGPTCSLARHLQLGVWTFTCCIGCIRCTRPTQHCLLPLSPQQARHQGTRGSSDSGSAATSAEQQQQHHQQLRQSQQQDAELFGEEEQQRQQQQRKGRQKGRHKVEQPPEKQQPQERKPPQRLPVTPEIERRCAGTLGSWCVDFYTQVEVLARTATRGNKTCSLDCNQVRC